MYTLKHYHSNCQWNRSANYVNYSLSNVISRYETYYTVQLVPYRILITVSSGEIPLKRKESFSLMLTSMNFIYLLTIVSVAAVNRLNLFKNHHHRHLARPKLVRRGSDQYRKGIVAINIQFKSSEDETINRYKLKKICNVATCSKCDKLMAMRSISASSSEKYCGIILNMADCCHTERFVHGGF